MGRGHYHVPRLMVQLSNGVARVGAQPSRALLYRQGAARPQASWPKGRGAPLHWPACEVVRTYFPTRGRPLLKTAVREGLSTPHSESDETQRMQATRQRGEAAQKTTFMWMPVSPNGVSSLVLRNFARCEYETVPGGRTNVLPPGCLTVSSQSIVSRLLGPGS